MPMASILPEVLKLAAIPGMSAACEAVLVLYAIVENVKIHKQRCRHLRNQCIEALLALKDHGAALGDSHSGMKIALDDFEAKILKIHSRMEQWSRLSLLSSIIRKDEISLGLDEFYKDLQFSSNKFQIAGAVEISRQQQEQRQLYDRDQAELREQLLQVVRQTDALKALMTSDNTNDVRQFMQTIQEEIQQADDPSDAASENDRQQLEQTLWRLHKESDVLPPMIDLTSEVRRISEFPVAHSGDSDVYEGEWLGEETVSLKFTRGFNHSDAAKKKFYYEVSIWRSLQHENIVRLYGIANFGGAIYTVSPWMENGDATKFLLQYPDVDRWKLVYEVAQGLNYLHCHGVAHGDLRCINILISKHFVACISDFGLSILISDIEESSGVDPTRRDNDLGSLRWRAPELIDYPDGSRPIITSATDVWSYGMLCLEVMTGQRPYHGLGMNDVAVMRAIGSGKVPSRPLNAAKELDDELWRLMNHCWQIKPENRPSMGQVVHQLKQRNPPQSVTGGPITGSPGSITRSLEAPSAADRSSLRSSRFTRPPSLRERERQRSGTVNSIASTRSDLHSAHTPNVPTSRRSTGFFSRLSPGSMRGVPSSQQETFPQSPTSSISSQGSLNVARGAPFIPQLTTHPRRPSRDNHRNASFDQSPFSIQVTQPSASSSLHEEFAHLTFGESGVPELEPPALLNPQSPTGPGDQLDLTLQDVPMVSSTGEVVAGTIAALLHRLLVPTDTLELDVQFRDTFLTCYTAFANADQVFAALQKRYRSAEQANLPHSVDTQNGILSILRLWLGEHRVFHKDADLLQAMKRFAQNIGGPTTISHYGLLLQSAIGKRETELNKGIHLLDRAHSTRVYAGFKASSAHPRDFAIGLTIWAWDLYADLLKSDFVSWLAQQTGQQFVENHLTLKSKLELWARKMIVESQSEEVRTARLTLFISIAQECRKLRNYLCMAALLSACNDWTIKQMRHTYGDLKKEAKDALAAMSVILDDRNDYKRYREELLSDSRAKRALIPDIDIHAKDIQKLWEGPRPTSLINGQQMINFSRYSAVTQEIKRVLAFQQNPIDLERYRDTGALAYLETTLNALEATNAIKQQLHERAEKLIASEKLAYENRVRELRDAGFGRPRRSSKK